MTMEIATLGGGCYWCLEAIYKRVQGVQKVESGYSGGHAERPSTMQVYGGKTGHAEVVQVTFDPSVISYREVLEIFFTMHDPTTLNRQDYDVGELYRSIILYHDDEQMQVAEDMMQNFAADLWENPIVTELKPFQVFWPAEADAQDFYDRNPYSGYCMAIINPKIQKLRQKFTSRLKPEFDG